MTINIENEEITKNECGLEVVPFIPDKYDHAIEYLVNNPEDIHDAWANPGEYEGRGGELFGFVGPDWQSNSNAVLDRDGSHLGTCGCLQQIRQAKKSGSDGKSGGMVMSYWARMWEKIANDRSLPSESDDIGISDLPVFAHWQREVDELRKADGFAVAACVY
jgi:hypothetical protein